MGTTRESLGVRCSISCGNDAPLVGLKPDLHPRVTPLSCVPIARHHHGFAVNC